ncbi:MAG: hypothetical protein JNL50_00655 [Phycisphaerae bacterium]|nr:hypothetical protein [Phycisphaerae bacterium]
MARSKSGDLAPPDWTCLKCGYSLVGVRVGGKCPECGTIIVPPKSSATRDDFMTNAPVAYLKGMAAGYFLMMVGGVGMIVSAWAAKANAQAWWMVLGVLLAGTWWAGVFVVTQARRSSVRPHAEMVEEWRRTRLANRVTQALWPAAFALGATGMFVHQAAMAAAMASPTATVGGLGAMPGGTIALYGLAGLCVLVASLGLVALCVQLSDLADWAGDTGLGNRLRVAAWGLAFGIPTVVFSPLVVSIPGVPGPLLFLLQMMFVLAIVTLIGCSLMFVTCLFSQCSMAFWAVRNSITGLERDIRVATKKAKRYEAIVDRQMANAPVSATPRSLKDAPIAPEPARSPGMRPKGPYVEPAKPGETYGVVEE